MVLLVILHDTVKFQSSNLHNFLRISAHQVKFQNPFHSTLKFDYSPHY
jgi:hypothetical protein